MNIEIGQPALAGGLKSIGQDIEPSLDAGNLHNATTASIHSPPGNLKGLPATAIPDFPVKVALLPNKGRSYVATRDIQPQELVFVAEAFGTTMCDPWLDCGVCHYCWMNIPDRKAQIRLPSPVDTSCRGKPGRNKKRVPAVMVFCDDICLQRYGPEIAESLCRVEQKLRRPWNEAGARHWKLKALAAPKTTQEGPATGAVSLTPLSLTEQHHTTLIQQALALAGSRKGILGLSDQDLAGFLNCAWGALDSLIAEQVSHILGTEDPARKQDSGVRAYTQEQCEALFPKLAKYLLEGNDEATIAAKTSDDDCETIRLMTEILYRRQPDMSSIAEDTSLDLCLSAERSTREGQRPVCGERATFADYCTMQSNELALVRQQLGEEMDGTDEGRTFCTRPAEGDHSKHIAPWRDLLSILPAHLLDCFYVYLRMRDAYMLLALEEEAASPTLATTLSMDNNLFRAMLYREVANSFGIRDASEELLGFAVFPLACFFNHSCRPNVEKKRRQGNKARQMEYWSTRAISAGEECCISYGDISTGWKERQERLQDMYFFTCSCPRCLEEQLGSSVDA
ncbi:hypothetical protein BGZ70_005541 [Mortierella alpina]|uniref:SET domain-containing protein n=1 Tax=Mortierella alpina TaxID=64518 RepID=A0A9P6M3J4_MORAP|nr:hypothetical protein BGZ70_005541 [Mortierella alpina]